MPQAATVLTIPVDALPTGFMADLSQAKKEGFGIVEACLIRLAQASSMLTVIKNDDANVTRCFQNAIGGVETMIDDVQALLSTVEGRA